MEHKNMRFCNSKICFLILTILAVHITAEDDTIVETRQGKVSGIKQSVMSRTVTAYLGIPYGEAPTGEKRFQKSEPRAPWHGVYNATTFGNSCYQRKENLASEISGMEKWFVKNEMSEDCLNLNVWVPQTMSKPAHVMVYIYGGSFFLGTSASDMYDGSLLAASEDVIVVSMNYRLGVFGFLGFPGNTKAPGNAGLFDQRLALQWVHENIAAFGGNPDSITIFGVSAGGASVGYHVISPGSHSYFNRAILQSGAPTANWAFNSHERSRRLSIQLAKLLNCPTEDEDATIACLQKVDAKDIVDKQFLNLSGFVLTVFVPILDNDFITEVPQNLVKESIMNTDIMIGIAKDDGNPLPVFGAPGFSVKNQSLITTEELKEGLRYFFPSADNLSVESMMLLYVDWDDEKNTEKNRKAMEQILRDNYFMCPAKYFADFASKTINNLYVYEYNHRSSDEFFPEWMGVIHGAELPMLFGKPLISPQQFTKQDQVFSRRLMKIWANFAKTGNPSDDEFNWPQYSAEEQRYAILKDPIDVKQKWNNQKCQFWNSFYPKLVKYLIHEEKS
ncbi:cholinesterase-like [Leptodactylus fuscus]|uniref:cholinesterase-like n=1 Tax=Leptodactylus fuscus TaxID=238119 RepID=UPI003F4F1982